MSRAAIFVAALTGSVVAFAHFLLPVVFFLGVTTIVRLAQVNWEDATWVQGMNRIRHAYFDLAPELEPYFVASKHDDDEGVLMTTLATRESCATVPGLRRDPRSRCRARGRCWHDRRNLRPGPRIRHATSVAMGVGVFVLTLAAFVVFAIWAVTRLWATMVVRFPTPTAGDGSAD
jgi:hypothetical protein